MSGQSERPIPRDVFEKQAYRCRPMETTKHSWRGLEIGDADKSRTGEASQKVVNRLFATLARTPTCSHESQLS